MQMAGMNFQTRSSINN
ncbi:MAG: DUF6783 domain-containing protein [Clostridiales bacterium]|nr:DUF6783 domain-containing protein [Clostridiales bacterium]